MTKEQTKYLLTRLKGIYQEHYAETTHRKLMSQEERVTAFNSGNYRIDQTTWNVRFGGTDDYNGWNKKMNEVRKNLLSEYNRLNDKIMFGDENDELLKLIQEFSNFKVN